MPTRRQVMLVSSALVGGAIVYVAKSWHSAAVRYDRAIEDIWRHTERHSPNRSGIDLSATNRELIRYATLAPSSHNTQCWKFRSGDRQIDILPDWTRRCPAVDPDDHHLFISLGCAAENLIQAAPAFSLQGEVGFNSVAGDSIEIVLEPAKAFISPLFEAIPQRQCTRSEYDGRKLSDEDLKTLELAGRGKGVNILLITEPNKIENIIDYVVRGNTIQMDDRAFVAELKSWIRFSYGEAVNTGDGLFAGCSGNPILPRWLGAKLLDLFFTAESENDKYAKRIRSSAGIAVFSSDRNDKEHWVEIGRCYERFALQATALGLKNAFLNQPVEVAALRPQFASYLGIGDRRADLVVRFGYGKEAPRSLRRQLDRVIESRSSD
jgi:hypothetical protein